MGDDGFVRLMTSRDRRSSRVDNRNSVPKSRPDGLLLFKYTMAFIVSRDREGKCTCQREKCAMGIAGGIIRKADNDAEMCRSEKDVGIMNSVSVHIHAVFIFFFQTRIGPVLLWSVVRVDVRATTVALHVRTEALRRVVVNWLTGEVSVLWHS